MTTIYKIKWIKIGLIVTVALAIILAFLSPQDKKIEESFDKKYSSQFFGYAFLYPLNLQLEAASRLAYATDIRMDEYIIVNPDGIELANSDSSEKNLIRHFIVLANKDGRNFLDYYYIKNRSYPVKEKKNVKIGEWKGKRYLLNDGRIIYTLEDDYFIHLFQVTSDYADSIFQNILPTFSFHEPLITSLDSFPKEPSSVEVAEVVLDNLGHGLIAVTYLDKTQLERHDYTIKPGDYVPDASALYKDDYSGIQFLQIFGTVENKWKLLHSETIDYRKNEYNAVSEFQISPVKISNNLKAILVKKEAKPKTYFVFGISGEEYAMFPIQFGYKNLDSYLHKEESADNKFKTVLEGIYEGASENRILREVYQVSFETDKSQIPVRTFYVEQEYKNGQFIPHYVEQKILPEGYHVWKNYLFYGNKPTMDKSISEYLYSETNEMAEYEEWFRREDGENLYIYLFGVGGHRYRYLTDYFIIRKSDNHIQKGHLNNFPAAIVDGIASPDKTKFAFVTHESFNSDQKVKETVKIYDFIEQTAKTVQEIDPDSTLLECGEGGCRLIAGTVEWVDNETIKVLPTKKN